MDADKELFLEEFGEFYGYPNGPKSIEEIRATEFKRLDGKFIYFILFVINIKKLVYFSNLFCFVDFVRSYILGSCWSNVVL